MFYDIKINIRTDTTNNRTILGCNRVKKYPGIFDMPGWIASGTIEVITIPGKSKSTDYTDTGL